MRRQAAKVPALDTAAAPASRPLQGWTEAEVKAQFERAFAECRGVEGAHCVHELWMRGEMPLSIERYLERLWAGCAASIPDWLPMRYIERLADIYEIALGFWAGARGRSNVYLVLLDYRDSRDDPFGLYVGMSRYGPTQRFDQHKAGIRAAGSVLRRGLEPLTGPTLHLQYIKRGDAARIEQEFAEALTAAGFFVQGGH